MSQNIYCDKAEYIDNDYICWYTGKPCTISPVPNLYLCNLYYKRKGEFTNGSTIRNRRSTKR